MYLKRLIISLTTHPNSSFALCESGALDLSKILRRKTNFLIFRYIFAKWKDASELQAKPLLPEPHKDKPS